MLLAGDWRFWTRATACLLWKIHLSHCRKQREPMALQVKKGWGLH